jgi:hypothetical protein
MLVFHQKTKLMLCNKIYQQLKLVYNRVTYVA